MACRQKMRKESGVCGQSPRQDRAPSPVAEISAACSLGAHTIWRPGEEEEDGKGQKQIVDFANKTSCPSCGPGGILEVQHFLPWNRMTKPPKNPLNLAVKDNLKGDVTEGCGKDLLGCS
ncbi:hypothetical protein HGM15179_008843 [Zosterops borbonicus]|uniref:Uncharacterized protein n=1 Tax=Zosterops borbonicus TaxID=364589 RepID=A0A8K1GGC3_9PASS|nr:hypothetical protein HGM15179_008843 [Zosterops borbonicus]